MADNTNSAADMLRGLLGDGAGEKLKSLLGSDNNSGKQEVLPEDAGSLQNDDYTQRVMNLVNELSRPNDTRSQLLLSLRPYMSDNRKRSIDNAVKLLNISKISGMFK